MIIGVGLVAGSFVGASPAVSAASVGGTIINWTKVLVWAGVSALFVSALMFVSASSD